MQVKTMYLDAGHPSRPGTKLNQVTGVIVHWTANESAGATAVMNRNYFNRGWKGSQSNAYELDGSSFRYASAHLNVDDTQLVECLPWKKGQAEMAYHVGAASYKSGICNTLGTTYPNNSTIGLEICVNSDGDFHKAYANGVQVIAQMLQEHGLGLDRLFRHFDITGKLCPGFFTQDVYAQKYLGTTADAAYAKFKQDVATVLSGGSVNVAPSNPYFKVYQQGQLFKYQFATEQGAEDCAKDLFKQSGGKDATIYATDPSLNVIYTPSKHPEDFPDLHPAVSVDKVGNTTVRSVKLPKGTFTMELVWAKGKTVSQIVKEKGATYGINFPYFWQGVPVADCKIGSQILNQGYDTPGGAQQTKWHGLRYKGGQPEIGMFDINEDIGSDGFLVKTSPLLIDKGNPCWDFFREQEGLASDIGVDTNGNPVRAQRTFVGIDKDGNFIIAAGDGREGGNGLTLAEMTDFMAARGAVYALNGDGGSSTVLADQTGSLGMNCGASERAVGHAVLFYYKGTKPVPAPTPVPQPTPAPAPAPTPKQFYHLIVDGKQTGAYTVLANGEADAQAAYRKSKSPNIVLNNPDGTPAYTPDKHPEDFPDLIVNGLNDATQKAVYDFLKKKFG